MATVAVAQPAFIPQSTPARAITPETKEAFQSVPVLDFNLYETDRARYFREFQYAIEDVGFFLLTNAPGFEDSVQKEMFDLCHELYSKPEEWKEQYSIVHSAALRGWYRNDRIEGPHKSFSEMFRVGTELPPPESKDGEEVSFGLRLHQGPNQWPAIPKFKENLTRILKRKEQVIHELERHACELLDIPFSVFDSYYPNRDPTEFAAAIWHYFPLNEESAKTEKDGFVKGLNEHRDQATFFTLTIESQPGLQIQNHEGEWIDVPHIPGGIVCNVGMQLMKLTGGRLVATNHRVNTLKISKDRYTIAIALNTRIDRTVTPLPQFAHSAKAHVMPRAPVTKLAAIEDPYERAGYTRLQLFPSATKKLYPKEWEEAEKKGIL